MEDKGDNKLIPLSLDDEINFAKVQYDVLLQTGGPHKTPNLVQRLAAINKKILELEAQRKIELDQNSVGISKDKNS